MVSIDENTQVAMEIVSQGTKLTGELLLKILRDLNHALENDKKNINTQFINRSDRNGKQKIKDLTEKHKNGIDTLEDNLTKDELKEYSKEFKKLGVDFSTVKVGKDSYSLFFSAKDSIVIEKALKNLIERKSLEMSKEQNKDNNLEVDNEIKNNKDEIEIESVESLQTVSDDKINLSDQEQDLDSNLISSSEKTISNKSNSVKQKSNSKNVSKSESKTSEKKSKKQVPFYSMANVKKLAEQFKQENKERNQEKNKEQKKSKEKEQSR